MRCFSSRKTGWVVPSVKAVENLLHHWEKPDEAGNLRGVKQAAEQPTADSKERNMEQVIRTTEDGRTVVVLSPIGRLDITTAWQFRLKLQECIAKASPHIVVNLGQVNFIDSSGLTSLVAGMRDANKVKGSFRICKLHPESKLVFEVTMMDSVFEIFETEEDALGVRRESPDMAAP